MLGLGERKRRILKAIIDEYIENAEPVGSKSIAMRSDLKLSSATIRNEMSDLEDMGYLEQPHISAGRIPSHAGYRLYVDELMNRYRLSIREVETINSALRLRMQELERLIHDAGRVMSELTNYTAYAAMPNMTMVTIRKFDLLFVDTHTVIIVLLTSTSIVKNKYHKSSAPVEEEPLVKLTLLLNNRFTGLTLDKITLSLIRQSENEAGTLSFLVTEVMDFVAEVLEENGANEVYVGGVSRILTHPEYRDPAKAQRILDYLSDQRGFYSHTRTRGNEDKGIVHIKIGSENEAEPLQDSSVVYGTYGINDRMKGIIGVVGPTRMDYAKVAANLNYFIEGLNNLIREVFLDGSEE